MRRGSVLAAALLGTLLLLVPLQSQAFFGFFGGGFSFGTGWSGWGGPGWWGPGWYGRPYYGARYYRWHRPYYRYRPWYWRRTFRPYGWPYRDHSPLWPDWNWTPFDRVTTPITPEAPTEK